MNSTSIDNIQDIRAIDDRTDLRIGRILHDAGKITIKDVEHILILQKDQNLRFGEAAKQLGLVTDADIQQALSQQFDYPCFPFGDGHFSNELIAAYMPFSPQVEALRALRSQLMLRWFSSDNKSIAIVGTSKGDGTSYITANLAVVFSQLGERTLLIDANLRRPRQHEIFQLPNREGITDFISGRNSMGVVQKVPDFLDLSILGAGTIPPNPQELLGRPAFNAILREVSSQFDVILVDTAPSPVTADAQIVAAKCGGALIIIRPNHTCLADSLAAKEMITSAGAEIVGAVVNQF